MIEIHLQDCLGELIIGSNKKPESVLVRKSIRGESLAQVVASLGLTQMELSDCYINGIPAPPSEIVEAGDRIDLFPICLGLLCGGHLK